MNETRNPTQVLYMEWGGIVPVWNWDKAPAGTWEVETSTDLINWKGTGIVNASPGSRCITVQLTAEDGFARIRKVS